MKKPMKLRAPKIHVYGARWPIYCGWYLALWKMYLVIEEDRRKNGCRAKPISTYKEMVYIEKSGVVHRVVWGSERNKNKHERGPHFQTSPLREWTGFESVFDSIGVVNTRKESRP